MPPLTRSAARAAKGNVEALALRAEVSRKRDAVWEHRGADLYTNRSCKDTHLPQVDHCLEIQLAEYALVRAYESVNARPSSMATAQSHEQLRDALNGVDNLNVTTRTINVWKRGPFTAALRRLNTDSLRDLTLEQLARQGRAAPLVDDGTWARIERAIVNSYDTTAEGLNNLTALESAAKLTAHTLDELMSVLERLGVYES